MRFHDSILWHICHYLIILHVCSHNPHKASIKSEFLHHLNCQFSQKSILSTIKFST